MTSNNPCNARDSSTKKITLLNRSQEISSLEDSESTISQHDARKNSTGTTNDEKQKIISTPYPNSFHNNVTPYTLPHRSYQNANQHDAIMNNANMVTYQNTLNFNPNSMQQMQFQHNYCQPPYLHPTTGIPMHHIHVMNQQTPSQAFHSPFPPFPSYPGYQPGTIINTIPYAVNSLPFSPPINQNPPPPPPPPPSQPLKKKQKKKPNERRIQIFRDKAARHQKALALGMALLNQMEESSPKEEITRDVSSPADDNISTTCLGNIKKNPNDEKVNAVSNVSFDINHNAIGSITNINITNKKPILNDDKAPTDSSVPANISISNPSSTRIARDSFIERTQVTTRSTPAKSDNHVMSSQTSATTHKSVHDISVNETSSTRKARNFPIEGTQVTSMSTLAKPDNIVKPLQKLATARVSSKGSNDNDNSLSRMTIHSRLTETNRKQLNSTPLTETNRTQKLDIHSTVNNKRTDNAMTCTKETKSTTPITDANPVSKVDNPKTGHCQSVKAATYAYPTKRRRFENDYNKDSYNSHYNEKERRRSNVLRSSTYSMSSSSERKKHITDNRSFSSCSKKSLKSLPSRNSSYDNNTLFGNSIPRKSKDKTYSSQYRNIPTHVIVQRDKSNENYSHHSLVNKNDQSSWRQRNNCSSGWGNLSSSSLVSNRQNDTFYNPLEPKKTTCYGGWLPIYYKGPPITTIKKKSKKPAKDKETKERNRKKRLELVKMLKDRLSKSVISDKVMRSESSFKILESKWKIEFLEQFPPEKTNLRLLWTTSFTNHFVGLKIYSMLGEAQLDIMEHISCYIIGLNAQSLKTTSKEETNHVEYALPMDFINIYKTNLFEMEYSDYRFLCGVMRLNKKKRTEAYRSGFLMNSNQVVEFCFGERGECTKKFVYGSEANYFYRKKRALLRIFIELDKKLETNQNLKEKEDTELPPITYDSDGNVSVHSYMFLDGNDDARDSVKREDTSIRETLMCLLFTGFEHSMKCPFSKVYSDINDLYPCYFPDEQCKNGRYGTLQTLLQHVQSKSCKFHDILGDYIRYFIEDKNEEIIKQFVENRASSIK